jgi:hypothetical protein
MKKIFLVLMAIAGLATCAWAQTTYNMNVRLNDGTVVTYAADDVAEVTFEEAEQPFNILTEEFIPDAVLRDYIKTNIANGEDVYTNVQAAAYNGAININGLRVFNFQGLEFFTNLQELYCSGINIQTIDISALKNLRVFDASSCQFLTSLTTGEMEKMEDFNISRCPKLTGYDLNQLPSSLKSLKVISLKYASIPFDLFPNLETLEADMNLLTELDLQGNTTIKRISLSGNALTSVNLNGCENLEYLVLSYNTNLSSIDISGCNHITDFFLQNTQIADLDLTPFAGSLKQLNVSYNGMTSLDVSQCTELTYLECQSNNLTQAMDFSNNTKLTDLRIESNLVPSVNLKNCNQLQTLNCYSNEALTSLILPDDQSHITLLNAFSIPNVTELNIGNMTAVEWFSVYVTGLTRIDISNVNQNAKGIYLYYNDNLRQIKVWSDFDMNNPPANVFKDDTAEFVYEFTEE